MFESVNSLRVLALTEISCTQVVVNHWILRRILQCRLVSGHRFSKLAKIVIRITLVLVCLPLVRIRGSGGSGFGLPRFRRPVSIRSCFSGNLCGPCGAGRSFHHKQCGSADKILYASWSLKDNRGAAHDVLALETA